MHYINYRCPYNGGVETVDSFDCWREAHAMIKEYNMSGNGYYLSQRATSEWRQSERKES